MTIILTFFVSCEEFRLITPFVGFCWGHVGQHATNDSKVCVNLTSISFRESQSTL